MSDVDSSKAIELSSPTKPVYLFNVGFSALVKLGGARDDDGDRQAYAHEGSKEQVDRYKWAIIEVDKGRNLYILQNSSVTSGYLFKGSMSDSDGDVRIYGHSSATNDGAKGDRNKFYIEKMSDAPPTYSIKTIDGYSVFAGNNKDDDGDHALFARPGIQSEDRFKWQLMAAS